MYKFFLSLFILSPFLFFIIGYPIVRREIKDEPFIQSQRCFLIGDTTTFINCYRHEKRLAGTNLVQEIFSYFYATEPFLVIIFSLNILLVVGGVLAFIYAQKNNL